MAAVVYYGSKILVNRVIFVGINLEIGRLKKMFAVKFNILFDVIRVLVLGEYGVIVMIVWLIVKVGEIILEGLVEFGKIIKEDYEEVFK